MKVTLKANDKRIYISKKLMKEMNLKRGNSVMIFRERSLEERYGFFPIDSKAVTDIDASKIRWSAKNGYFIRPDKPPAEFLRAVYGVQDELEMRVVKEKLKEADIFLWERE